MKLAMNKILILTLVILAVAAIPVTVTAQYPVITGEPNPDYNMDLVDIEPLTTEPIQNNDIEPDLTDRPNQESHSGICDHIAISENNNERAIELCRFGDNFNHFFGAAPQVIPQGEFLNAWVTLDRDQLPSSTARLGVIITPLKANGDLNLNDIKVNFDVPVDRNGHGDTYVRIDDRFEPNTKYTASLLYKDQRKENIVYFVEFYVLPSSIQGSTITNILNRITALETSTPTTGSTVSGTVTDSATNNPISGASVSIGSLSDTTSSSGSYTIPNVPVGSDSISVSYVGYNTATQPVTVTAGQTSTINIQLTPVPVTSGSGTVFGTIHDSVTNVGIQGITISISTDPPRAFTTGAGGIFIIPNIPAGTYTISAAGTDYNENTTSVTVVSSQTIISRFTLTPMTVTTTSSISGTITDSVGNTISGAVVIISTDPEMNTVTNNAGVFTFSNVPAGTYEITVITPSDGAITRSITVPSSNYDFALPPDSLISGTVTDADGVGVSGITVTVLNQNLTTTTNNHGWYAFNDDSLIGNTVSLYITIPDGYVRIGDFFATVTVVDGENKTANFTLRSTAPITPTSPTTQSTTIKGTVWYDINSDGNIDSFESVRAGATVTLYKPDGTTDETTTDSNGMYQFTNVGTGLHNIYVNDDGDRAYEYVSPNTDQTEITINLGLT